MSEPKFTPGPWKVVMPYHAHARETCRCVQIGRDEAYTTSEVLTADARLIASAPELLASCRESAEFFESTEKVDREYHTEHRTLHLFTTDPLLVRLRAAIQKAEGGTQ